MPYLLTEEGVIVEDLDGVSWTDVIKQQRALRSNQARVASMYAQLDALEEVIEETVEETLPKMEDHLKGSELVKIVVGNEQDRALTASVVEALEASNGRLEQTEKMVLSLTAALEQMSTNTPVVNVTSPDVHVDVPPAQVTVEAPQITVQPPDVIVPPANITVHPEIVMPTEGRESKRSVTFVRDFSGRIEGAEIVEE